MLAMARDEKCLKCGALFPVHKLKEHVLGCNVEEMIPESKRRINADNLQADDEDSDKDELPFTSVKGAGRMSAGGTSKDPLFVEDDANALREVDDSLLQYAIQKSQEIEDNEIREIGEIVSVLKKNLSASDDYFPMIVRRGSLLESTLSRLTKASFDPAKRMRVEFVGEQGSDTGGLMREFFTLLAKSVTPLYIDNKGCFQHNSIALQDRSFYHLGQLASMCLVHGGGGFHVLSSSVFKYVSGKQLAEINPSPEEVSDLDVKRLIDEISATTNLQELRATYISHFSVLADYGISKPSTAISLEDKNTIVQSITLHHILLKSKAEVDQFSEGLSCLGTKNYIIKYPHLLQEFFTLGGMKVLTAEFIRNLFTTIRYSEVGSNEREKEELTYVFFVDYLEEREEASKAEESQTESSGENVEVTLATILNFFSGAEEIPPEGFPNEVVLSFNPENPFPTSSTCAVELTLPTKYCKDYYTFKKMLTIAFTCHGGFGKN